MFDFFKKKKKKEFIIFIKKKEKCIKKGTHRNRNNFYVYLKILI